MLKLFVRLPWSHSSAWLRQLVQRPRIRTLSQARQHRRNHPRTSRRRRRLRSCRSRKRRAAIDARARTTSRDWHFIGHVEMDLGNNTTVYAEDARVYTGTKQGRRTGNVLFPQGNNRISAERAEFDTETRLGTFYNAWASRPFSRSLRGVDPAASRRRQ